MSQFAFLKVGALKVVFPFHYKIVCRLVRFQKSCLGQDRVVGAREAGVGGTSEVGALVTI